MLKKFKWFENENYYLVIEIHGPIREIFLKKKNTDKQLFLDFLNLEESHDKYEYGFIMSISDFDFFVRHLKLDESITKFFEREEENNERWEKE